MLFTSKKLRTAIAVAITGTLVSACAGMGNNGGGTQEITAEQKANDGCYAQYVLPIANANNYYNNEIKQYTAAGAAGGALIGGLGTALAGGSTRDVVAGVVVGGIAGAVTGYLTAKQKQYSDKGQMRAAIEADASASYGRMSDIGANIQDLGECRRVQIAQIDKKYRKKEISKEQARAQIAQIDAWRAEDDRQIAALLNTTEQDAGVYTQALATSDQSNTNVVLGDAAYYQGEPLPPRHSKKKHHPHHPKAKTQVQERVMIQQDVKATHTADKAETDQKMASLKQMVAI